MFRKAWNTYWRFFCQLEEPDSWTMIAVAIFGGVFGGAFAWMIVEALTNQTLGVVTGVVVYVASLIVLVSVEYGSEIYSGDHR